MKKRYILLISCLSFLFLISLVFISLDARNSQLAAGFKRSLQPEEYLEALEQECVEDLLHYDSVQHGDLYFIPPGRVHTICSGCFIFEVQEPSDTTYRIYDYGRRDIEGNPRVLHTEKALQVLDFSSEPPYSLPYTEQKQSLNRLLQTSYFIFSSLLIEEEYRFTKKDTEGCALFFVENGEVLIIDRDGKEELLKRGFTYLLPSELIPLVIKPLEKSKLLVITLPE